MVEFSPERELVLAFQQEGTPSLSTHQQTRENQGLLLERIARSIAESYPVVRILAELGAKSGTHFYHGLRTGVYFLDLVLQEIDVVRHVSPHTLSIAGVVHDGGKTCVYDEILEGGELDERERRIMRAHNRLTSMRLRGMEEYFFPKLRSITAPHHPYPRAGAERRILDRRELGIPVPSQEDERSGTDRRQGQRREKDDLIERAALLLRICDTYDAWASKRSYKEPFSAERIKEEFGRTFPDEPITRIQYLLEMYPVPRE